jgi:hypothetical protein
MITKRERFRPVSSFGMRRANDPPVRFWPRISFVSTCPKCGHERLQRGYTRRALFSLLDTRRTVDAYCTVCNVCWPITEGERHAISPR